LTADSGSLGDAALASIALAHELQNSLAVVASSLYLARRDRADPAALERHLAASSAQVDEAQRVVRAVLRLTRGAALVGDSCAASSLVARACRAVLSPANVRLVDTTSGDPREVHGDDTLLVRAIANLVQNAVEALGASGGAVEVSLAGADDRLVVAVEDDGPGVDPAVAETLFEPRVTTKAYGTGVGLAFVRVVMRAHGGDVRLAAGRGRGARFELCFPPATS